MSASPDQIPTNQNHPRAITGIDDVDEASDPTTLREDVEKQVEGQDERTNDEDVPFSPSDKVLSVTAFLESIGDRPVYTQKLLRSAACQLRLAKEGEEVKLSDCFGNQTIMSTAELIAQRYVPSRRFNFNVSAFKN